jgi:hypothetical protein
MRRALIGCETSGIFRRAFAARVSDWLRQAGLKQEDEA